MNKEHASAALAQLAGLVGHPELRILNLSEFKACEHALRTLDHFIKESEPKSASTEKSEADTQ